MWKKKNRTEPLQSNHLIGGRDVELLGPGVVAPILDNGVLDNSGDLLGDGGAVGVLGLDECEGEVDAGCDLLWLFVSASDGSLGAQ